ncbi:TM2 domain-containing protein [[Mycobacterium] nativiensis]|uniref:TM2 domain-containing protein n=1 Tax=[Mycobacterium] nativiensis TaxID=2855503 RepID=A0ABU5XUM6_9MYCO|nr:TM2 domain-containing protein [Mycolicibacter sp. MYC340]MEB3030716.1 TM2 domain-containing protein [Mycolicibacter sp. MYC340]
MTDPSWPPVGPDGNWQPFQQPPGYPPPYPGQPDPWAPHGRHPVTGQPYSDRSKVTAALLQLLGVFGFLGFGRIYLGQTGFGIAQLLTGMLITVVTWGVGAGVPIIWGIVDAILMLSGRVHDRQGRPLR